jgi:hypothetical protein
MEDVLDIYSGPYNPEYPVVCVDEKPVPLVGDTRDQVPMKEGSVRKVDYEYGRNCSVHVFVGVEPKIGRYLNEVTEQRCSTDFAMILYTLAAAYSEARKIILVMDNLSTHSKMPLTESLGEELGTQV